MKGLTGWGRWLTAAAMLALTAPGAQAQLKPWPDQQPPQAAPQQAWPGEGGPAAPGAVQPMAVQPPPMNAAPPPGMGMGMGAGAPPDNPCMGEFTKMRTAVERAGQVAKNINDRKGTREEFCKAITSLHGAQARWAKYAVDNSKNCGIPQEIIGQLRLGATNLNKMRTSVCSGGGTAAAPPAPSLSEALGTARLPANEDAPRRRGGTLDTLTGETIR